MSNIIAIATKLSVDGRVDPRLLSKLNEITEKIFERSTQAVKSTQITKR